MVEYLSIMAGLGILVYIIFQIAEKLELPDPLQTRIVEYFRIGLYLVAFLLGLPIIGLMVEIMKLQTGWSQADISLLMTWYVAWIAILVIYLVFIIIYTIFLLPAQAKAIQEVQKKREDGLL